ncbi:hypothetical protein B0T16DRAFT_448372 [Cercophora newfieldiana]|uniref:Uncharacterized protein n=1 Tax=Cercophora newfieldiana TaxID=92897 RepID=A0AA39XUY4_9PEZI|nr:hypothetical protein B0T16DRAFT_448372 [Cercophora newfieldiana]
MPLLDLSNELLNEIAMHLIPSMDGDLASYVPDPDIAVCRITLLSLAKTNRRLNATAIRHLYHTVCIDDLHMLFALLRTFILNDDLADMVRVLSVFASLNEDLDPDTDEMSEQMFAGLTPDLKAHQFLGYCFEDMDSMEASDLTWTNCDNYPQSACALLLYLTGKLEALYLHLPPWNAGDYRFINGVFEESSRGRETQDTPAFVPNLSSLSLTADPRASDPRLDSDVPQCLMGNQGIKNLEIFGATLLHDKAGNFGDLLPARWSSLETIRLPYVCTRGIWLHHMCEVARPRLKRIEIWLSPRLDQRAESDTGPGYDQAFLLCADSLEHLKLGSRLVNSLPCLPSLLRLRSLELSVTDIFPTADAMRGADICDHFPPSLRSLFLVDDLWEPWEHSGSPVAEEEYASLLKAAFSRLLLGSGKKLPRLRDVCVQVTASSWGDYHEKSTEIRHLCTASPQFGGPFRVSGVTVQATESDAE